MELQLVSFEQAKALKELGFPNVDDTRYYYDIEGNCIPYLDYAFHRMFHCQAYCLDIVAKWLREEKHIDVLIGRYMDSKTYLYGIIASTKQYGEIEDNNIEYPTYEEALSAGIDEAIEILRKRN